MSKEQSQRKLTIEWNCLEETELGLKTIEASLGQQKEKLSVKQYVITKYALSAKINGRLENIFSGTAGIVSFILRNEQQAIPKRYTHNLSSAHICGSKDQDSWPRVIVDFTCGRFVVSPLVFFDPEFLSNAIDMQTGSGN